MNTMIPQTGHIQSSAEFVLKSRNYNKILIQISTAACAAI